MQYLSAKALLVQASMEPVCLIRLCRNMQYRFIERALEDDHLVSSIFTGHSSRCSASLQHVAITPSAGTPLNSINKHCLLHFQWVTVDAAVLLLCISPTSGNMQTLHSINSNINKHCLFHFQWVMAVDAVLVLRMVEWNNKLDNFTQQKPLKYTPLMKT